MIYLYTERKIEKLRVKLHDNIEKFGIDSKETRKVSIQLDKLINEYYKDIKPDDKFPNWSEMYNAYLISYMHLKDLTIDLLEFPSVKVWTEYADKNNCLNAVAMEFVSGLNWHKLEQKVVNEINKKS